MLGAWYDGAMKKKNKAAQELARRRNKKYGKKWLKANADKMVAARKSKIHGTS